MTPDTLRDGALRYGSVCSGIEAASAAWSPLGMEAAFVAEIEKAPCAVLAHHYPHVPNHGDVTKFQDWPEHAIDVLVGGTPCQSFSVAGLRKGLDDPRGSLMLTFGAIARKYRPAWLLWENVPGVLSSDGGRDFGTFLGMLGELGYGFAYRVLDAQHFGVPQRRRRVFVVGHLGDWRPAAAVLFERESLCGHPAPRRETREGIAPTISARTKGGGGLGTDFDCDGGLITPTLNATYGEQTGQDYMNGLIAFGTKEFAQDAGRVSPPLRAMPHNKSHQNGGGQIAIAYAIQERAVSENLENGPQGKGFQADHAYTLEARNKTQAVAYQTSGNCGAWETGDVTGALDTMTDPNSHVLAFAQNQRDEVRVMDMAGALPAEPGMKQQTYVAFNITPSNSNKDYNARASDRAQAITGNGNRPSARGGDLIATSAIRRLTPRECERLQGFPDDYTLVTYRGKPMADGPRYKMLGNSMAVPVMSWIGQRILLVSAILASQEQAA